MKKRLLILFGLVGLGILFPEVVRADNCSFFADCFNNAKAAAAAAAAMGIVAAVVSAAADLTPGVGELKAGVQLITGKDPITNKEVPRWQSAIGLIPVFGRVASSGMRYGMAAARAGGALQTARGLRTASKGLRTGIDIYETARQPYDIATTIRDTADDVAGQINNYIGQAAVKPSRTVGTTVSGMGSPATSRGPQTYVARAIPFEMYAQMLNRGFRSTPQEAPATVAEKTLTTLAKTFGKNSEVLSHIAKTNKSLAGLPGDAKMKDVVEKLKE